MQPGIYKARAISDSVQYGFTANNNPQIAIDLAIEEDVVTTFLYFTDKTEAQSLSRLRLLGWNGQHLDKLGELPNIVDVRVSNDEYQGKPQTRADIILPSSSKVALAKKMTSNDLAAFARRYAPADAAPVDLDIDDGRAPF